VSGMTLLDELIDGATSDTMSTANLLRKVQVVAHRLDAHEVKAWAQRELVGFGPDDPLPDYRSNLWTPVQGFWTGPMGSSAHQPVSAGRIADEMRELLFRADLRQSLAELEQLASGNDDPGIMWDGPSVVMFNLWVKRGLTTGINGMNLFGATQTLTRGTLLGVIDTVKTTAMEFALALQTANPDAGTVNGPTIADEPVASAVTHIENHIYGDHAQVAQGAAVTQHMTVARGDLMSLLEAATAAGLDDEGKRELAAAVTADEAERPSRVKRFLGKVGEGAFLLGTGVATEVAATQLSDLITAYLGG